MHLSPWSASYPQINYLSRVSHSTDRAIVNRQQIEYSNFDYRLIIAEQRVHRNFLLIVIAQRTCVFPRFDDLSLHYQSFIVA